MKLSDYVIKYIHQKYHLDHIFTFAGGSIIHLLTSLYDYQKIQNIVVHHEQAAAFAADAYSRITGNICIAMATSGPGATNLITGIGGCWFDSIPCMFITGQVNTYESKFNTNVRQMGFQETDIVEIVRPITKYAKLITDAKSIKYELQKAYYISKIGRPGPVLLDIPMNIQRTEINLKELKEYSYLKMKVGKISQLEIKKMINLINSSKRPIIIAGGGIRVSGTRNKLIAFSEITKIPVVTTIMGLDVIPHSHSLHIGYLGAYGNRYANFSVANSDLLIVLGSRLTSRQTGTNIELFARNAKIIQVDVDKNEIKRKIKIHLPINMDLNDFFKILEKEYKNITSNQSTQWLTYIKKIKEKYPSYSINKTKINPNYFIKCLSKKMPPDSIIATDIGQNQIWVAQSFQIKNNQRLLMSGGMGPMGYSLPAAIGAYFANKTKNIYSFCGDGGFQINIQELNTIVRNKIPVKIIVLNNSSLGMIRQFQDLYFDSKYEGTRKGYNAPDFISIAKAYNIKTLLLKTNNQFLSAIDKIINYNKPLLVNVIIDEYQNAEPKLEVNRAIEDQHPLLDRQELKNNLIMVGNE